MIDRRLFHRTLGLTALTATVPAFLHKTGAALAADPKRDDRVLVVIQLGGGNDGLNTVVPFADDRYHKARPKIAVDAKSVLKIDDALGFHPEMAELHKLYKDGGLAVVPNVGYPNPNRSHFRSTDIWETASPADKILKSGWLGRYFDAACGGVTADPLGVRIGEQPSLAFAADKLRAATFANPKMLDNPATGPAATALEKLAAVEPTGIAALDFVQRTGNQSLALSKELKRAVRAVKPKVDYPPFALCQSLRLVAQMIAAGLPTRAYYVTHGGFDTHAAQAQKHAYLLQEFSQAVALFHADLKAQGLLDRVLGLTFSEFGRRVAENKNAGTDHGAASVMFAFGGSVKAGVHGKAPDLAALDPLGDLVHQTDFRQVYAGVLKDWLGADPEKVLLGKFDPLPLVTA
jgi:uncharacterized protein (DUF1501 family)